MFYYIIFVRDYSLFMYILTVHGGGELGFLKLEDGVS